MSFASNKTPGTKDFNPVNAPPEPVSKSFFGKTMRIEGEITSDEDVTIEGRVNGQVEVTKTLTIGKDGYVNGKISAAVVRISGEAEGFITASEKLEISSDGKYTGNIKSQKMKVAEGAKLKATINLDSGEDTVPIEREVPAEFLEHLAQPAEPSGAIIVEEEEEEEKEAILNS
jgi:cytoskeletal protein CcmA (bactofilin family)